MGQATLAPALQDIHRRFVAAFNARDLKTLVALYEPEAVFVGMDGAILRGREEIREVMRQMLASGVTIAMETAGIVEGTGGLAVLHGRWMLTGTGPDGSAFERKGTSAEVVRRQPNGEWLFAIDNPSTP